MSLFFNDPNLGDSPNHLIPSRRLRGPAARVTPETALTMSAVWACVGLRAGLESTLPLDVYRMAGGMQLEAPRTPFLEDPAGDGYGLADWLYSSRVDLDRTGNAFGIITAKDALGNPAQVELVARTDVRVHGSGPKITGYTIRRKEYQPEQIWHERQYTVPGIPLGLSPVAHAAMTIGTYQSAQDFAADWFTGGAIPSGRLKNVNRTITREEAIKAKRIYREAVAGRDLFVHGSDWEYDPIATAQNESQFIETMGFGITDVCRFFGIPGDLIDAAGPSSVSITYANISQRNLQLLIMNLNPAITRRERKLSLALPRPRFVRFDTDSLMRMDPETREKLFIAQVAGRTLAPSEARAMSNRPPFTPDQIDEFYAVGLVKSIAEKTAAEQAQQDPADPGGPLP